MIVVMADDDRDDCEMVAAACLEVGNGHELVFVADGEELLDYLKRRGRFSDESSAPRPGLILLDLNMPRMDGRQALQVIKADPSLRRIPVVVLTTSDAEEDVVHAYDTGAAGYITKPTEHSSLVDMCRRVLDYWFRTVVISPNGV